MNVYPPAGELLILILKSFAIVFPPDITLPVSVLPLKRGILHLRYICEGLLDGELITIEDCGAFDSDVILLNSYELFSNTSADVAPYQISDILSSENTIAILAPWIRLVLNRFNSTYIS